MNANGLINRDVSVEIVRPSADQRLEMRDEGLGSGTRETPLAPLNRRSEHISLDNSQTSETGTANERQ